MHNRTDRNRAQSHIEPFSALAPLLRVRPELQQICRFGAQWVSQHGPERGGWAPFHLVTSGACQLVGDDGAAITLRAGDVAILPHGGAHSVRALPDASGATVAMRATPRVHDPIVVRSNVEREPDTGLICGRLLFEQAQDNLVLAALPPVVVLRPGDGPDARRVRELVMTAQAELQEDRLGAAAIASALAGSLLTIVLRAYLERAGAEHGVLGLLATRQTARALAVMLGDLSHPWTLDELAATANCSRATLVRMFRKAVGTPPLAYLADLRLSFARQRLQASSASLAVICDEIGYQSEAAFSRAYHRRFGSAPSADRRADSG